MERQEVKVAHLPFAFDILIFSAYKKIFLTVNVNFLCSIFTAKKGCLAQQFLQIERYFLLL